MCSGKGTPVESHCNTNDSDKTYIVTGEVKTVVIIGGIDFVLKFIIYYGHERA